MATYQWRGVTGDWTTTGDWTPRIAPGAGDTAIIAASGLYAADIASGETISVQSVTLNAAGATLDVEGSLSVSGTLALDSGILLLDGVIARSTIRHSGGSVIANGTLDNVIFQGALDVSAGNGLTIADALRVTSLTGGAGGAGGVINIVGDTYLNDYSAHSSVTFAASATSLDGVTINVTAPSGSGGGDATAYANLIFSAADFVLGSKIVINDAGLNGISIAGTLVNNGVMNISPGANSGGTWLTGGDLFVNAGAIHIAAGGELVDETAATRNTGAITLGGSATADFDGGLENDGTITVADSAIVTMAALDGAGSVTLRSNSWLVADSISGQTLSLQGTGILVSMAASSSFSLALHGFVSSDRIDLDNFSVLASTVGVSGTSVIVRDGTLSATIDMFKLAAGLGFALVPDGAYRSQAGGAFLITAPITNGPIGGHATIAITGGNGIVNAHGTGNSIAMTMGDGVINAGTGGAIVTTGWGDVVVDLAGAGNSVTTGYGVDLIRGATSSSVVVMKHFASFTGPAWDNAILTGDHNAVIGDGTIALTGDANTITGWNDTFATVTGNDNVIKAGGLSNAITVSGDGDTVKLIGGQDTVRASGSSNMVFVAPGGSANITDSGHGLTVVTASGASAASIAGAASDPSFVLDLVGGVGGYGSVAQVLAALTPDGFGDLTLKLGSGSIDFTGTSAGQLTALNFALHSS